MRTSYHADDGSVAAMRASIVWAMLLLLLPISAGAAPSTLYKPADIVNARENAKRHAWAREIVSRWEQAAAPLLQWDRESLRALVPALTPGTFYGQNCPACLGRKSVMGESGLFAWSLAHPEQVRCRRCGTVFPNPEYPESGILHCPRMGQTFTYYQPDAERALGADAPAEKRAAHAFRWLGTRPTMTSFSGMVRAGQVRWAWGITPQLGKLYALTGDVRYAERTAWILERLAEVFPNYLFHSYDGSVADLPPALVAAGMGDPTTRAGGRFPPAAIRHAYGLNQHRDDAGEYATLYNGFWGAGRLNPHGKGSDAGPLLSLTLAYDLTRDASSADGTPVYSETMHQRIRDNLLLDGSDAMEHWDAINNKGVATLSLSAAVGLLYEQPERLHRAVTGFSRLLAERYHADGFYSESPAYAAHNYGNLRELPDLLCGYSDPPGFTPRDGDRLAELNPYSSGQVHLALLAMVRQLAPGNRLPVIGDTTYETVISPLYAEILAARLGGPYAGLLETLVGKPLSSWGNEYSLWYRPPDLTAVADMPLPLRSEWFPGWHVAVLRANSTLQDTALFLNGNEHTWTLQTGHRQRDILSMSLYAFGEEAVSDRGYFSGSGQRLPDGRSGQEWVSSSLSHNLVVVDESSQERRQAGSNLELFAVAPGIEVVQASAFAAYPQCDVYTRTTVCLTMPNGRPCFVDMFRVRGGRIHQYVFHANGSLAGIPSDQPAQAVSLSPTWAKWLENPRALTPRSPLALTWNVSPRVDLDLWVLNTNNSITSVILADAPGWRRGSPASQLDRPPIQQILLENRPPDTDRTTTQYATVCVPYAAGSSAPILAARLLVNDHSNGTLAVEIRFAERTDIIASSLSDAPLQVGPMTMRGHFGIASVDAADQPLRAYLLDGTELSCGKMRLQLPQPRLELRVAATSGRTFHLADPLPPDLKPAGSYLLADGPAPREEGLPKPRTGFEVQAADRSSITVRDYPLYPSASISLLCSAYVGALPEQQPATHP